MVGPPMAAGEPFDLLPPIGSGDSVFAPTAEDIVSPNRRLIQNSQELFAPVQRVIIGLKQIAENVLQPIIHATKCDVPAREKDIPKYAILSADDRRGGVPSMTDAQPDRHQPKDVEIREVTSP